MRRSLSTLYVVLGLAACTTSASAASWSRESLRGTVHLSVPHVAVNARGESVAIWRTSSGTLLAAIQRAGARRFAPAQVIGRNAVGEQVAIDPRGTAIVVWAQTAKRSPRYRVVAAVRPPGGSFRAARLLGAAESARRASPYVAFDRRRDAYVAWHRNAGFAIVKRLARGRFGAARTPLGMILSIDAFALTPTGRLAFAWTVTGPDGPYIAYSEWRAGRPALTPTPISATGRQDPVLAVAPNGIVAAAWRTGDRDAEGPGTGGIEATTSRIGFHRFRAPALVSPADEAAFAPLLAVGPRGEAAVSWDKTDGGYPDVTPASEFAWLATRPRAGIFAPAQALAPLGVQTLAPAAAFDAAGTLTVAVVRNVGTARQLEIRRGAPGIALPEPVVTDSSTSNSHPLWTSAAVASTGHYTVVVWTSGLRGPVRAYSLHD